MTNDIISLQSLVNSRFRFTPLGLLIADDTSYEDWQAVGITLRQLENAIQFAIGDWIIWGERKWGESYAQAIDETGLAIGTLQNYAYVAGNVPISRRQEGLSFSHHAEVASLSPREQIEKLNMAHQMGMSVRELRAVIRGSNGGIESLVYAAQILELQGGVVLRILDGDIHTLLMMAGSQVTVMIDPLPLGRKAGGGG